MTSQNKEIAPVVIDDTEIPVASIPRADDSGSRNTNMDRANLTDTETSPVDDELFEKYLECRKKRTSIQTFPEDSYSLIALNFPTKGEGFGLDWWKNKAPAFFFGLMPFVFQIMLLYVSLLSAVEAFEESDADMEFFARLFHASSSVFVTQVTILLAYACLPRSSLRDIIMAIHFFPSCSRASSDNRAVGIMVSCILRLSQGFMGIITILAVIFFKSEDAITIILNFTALDYISELDEYAFSLCKSGLFGKKLEEKADAITDEALPEYMKTRQERKWFQSVLFPSAIMFFIPTLFLIISQVNSELWTTKMLRVEFGKETLLGKLSGCFAINGTFKNDERHMYHKVNDTTLSIGYCRGDRRWVLFRGTSDPCEAKKRGQAVALSSKTESYEISASFSESWTSSSGVPLELYFFESDRDERNLMCNLEIGDGVCDPEFNFFDYNYDEGDCCSATCKGSMCGRRRNMTGYVDSYMRAFGVADLIWDGFPACKNPNMVPITIQLHSMTSSRDPKIVPTDLNWYYDILSDASLEQWLYSSDPRVNITEREAAEQFLQKETRKWRSEPPKSTYFAIDCNGKNVLTVYFDQRAKDSFETEYMFETVFVEDGATCTMIVPTIEDQKADEPIWVFNYTLFHDGFPNWNERIEILNKQSWPDKYQRFTRFPDCFFHKLTPHNIDIQSIYTSSGPSTKALEWIVKDEPKISQCEDFDFVERYALTNIHFSMNGTGSLITREEQCTLPAVECSAGKVQSLDLRSLHATNNQVPSEIVLLQNLKELYLAENQFVDMTSLTDLSSLHLGTNSTSMLREINKLTALRTLALHQSEIESFPTELIDLSIQEGLWHLDLSHNFIHKIHTEIGSLSSLKNLDLCCNNIGEIPSDIGGLSRLQTLDLSWNFIMEIPAEISGTSSLQTLDLCECMASIDWIVFFRYLTLSNDGLR
mmetsp:Transcript_15464/g.35827  ORF Transcript_15464/g.35827 Transcript_15464/m.35827 type:complete len:935 (-) Transcript_15464:520-3324(-)